MTVLRITLTDEDREAFGAPDVLEYDLSRPRLRELRALESQCGVGWQALLDRLKPGTDLTAFGMLLWIALMRHGVEVPPWESFDVDVVGSKVDEQVTEGPKPRPRKRTA